MTTARDAILQLLAQCGSAGALTSVIVANVSGAAERSVQNMLSKLADAGLVVRVCDPAPGAGRRLRYFLRTHAPAGWQHRAPPPYRRRPKADGQGWQSGMGGVTFAPSQRGARARLDPAQPAIVPPGVKVTHCPGCPDTRYSIPAGTKVAGAGFVAEWRRLRRKGRHSGAPA